ncbi:MAG TPA: RNA 2',3'-cyclic phosphodiesterase [Burkholderiales bacterium]|nr:RNA 2',3'-cyclic phosphodiesterase [Burkholderiales bacterium]
MRLFFALWPPAETAAALAEWARQFDGRAVAAANVHLTLAFLGDVDERNACEAARTVRGRKHALPIDRARYWRHNKILWVGPRDTPQPLLALVDQLHGSLRQNGFVLEERPFAAHVTLVRKARAPSALSRLPAVTWPVEEFALVASTPGRTGASYRTLEAFQLR